jgi:hypothetical protein
MKRFLGMLSIMAVVVTAFLAGRLSAPPTIASAQPAPGQQFSHFKCYQTSVKLEKPAEVVLRDQFGTSKMVLNFADLFCAPVEKRLVNAKPLPVPGPADHLMCYRGEAPAVSQTRPFINQLQRGEVRVLTPRYLCVPTWKRHILGAAG